ncbi:MAG: AAA family ATPase [Micropruina sp.]|uniref:AAA family ATPase n=1 Tax=Micropruina sp. TaxID=2737536 RepID=UPI0039E33F0F
MITTLAVHGYRSLREVVLPLERLTVVTGANGVGKSNLYRAFQLLAGTASGRLIGAIAAAGGLSSVLWAGPEQVSGAMRRGEVPVQGTGSRKAPISLQLGFAGDDLGYLIDIGLPVPAQTMFGRDPTIKREIIWAGPVMRPAATLLERTARGVRAVDEAGRASTRTTGHIEVGLPPWASVLDELVDPIHRPEVTAVRDVVRGWRFYDSFRVDPDAPARQPQVGTRTEVLAGDGHDLAPAVATILESAWEHPFQQAVADAFDATMIGVVDHGGRFEVELHQPAMLRALTARELSDGTLRYLLLAAALFSPRPPGLMVLNEPETSLHPDVLPALTRLMVRAAERTQLVVVTHSRALVEALTEAGALHHELVKPFGETEVDGQGLLSRPTWQWGKR